MKQFFLVVCIFLAFTGLQGCSSATPAKAEVKTETHEAVTPNRKLSLEIEGMVCEKGCGASIRKALKSTGGVANCTFDFKEDREKNTATIEFDKDKISADKIIDIVTTINEGQFSVSKSNAAPMDVKVNAKESATGQSTSNETAEINVKNGNYEMPNLLELFSGLLTRS